MDRRAFMTAAGLTAATVMAPGAGAQSMDVKPESWKQTQVTGRIKLGQESAESTDKYYAYLARYGVRHTVGSPVIEDPNRLYPTVDELHKLKELGSRHGVTVEMIKGKFLGSGGKNVDHQKHPAIVLGESPERDRLIDAFNTTIRNCARVGIPAVKYNLEILGVLRDEHVSGRGDAEYVGWDLSKAPKRLPLTKAGTVDAHAFWERIQYFLDRVVPVANEYRIRIACHPQDPGVPVSGYRGVVRVLGTIRGLKRFVEYRESPYHGLNFCQGTIAEDLERPNQQIHEVIRWFGERKKIFNVHFRNIRGHRNDFVETFQDDGSVDMVKCLQTYRAVGYEGMLCPDHSVPVPGDPDARIEDFAFMFGYIRGLIQSADILT